MIRDVNYYHMLINDYIETDLKDCNYDYYQHNINLRCYLSELYKKMKSKFDLTIDDLSPLYFVNDKLNEVKKYLCNYRNNVVRVS
jgi:hypothetical protein